MSTAPPVVRTIALSKSYGKRLAVDKLDLEINRAELSGFLGPNGAGKTTTIRMALGLIAPSGGSVEVLRREVRSFRAEVLPRVGALVESPALYGYMSGLDNLRAVGDLLGGMPRGRIDEVLEIVSLKGRERDRVKTYSMGMKQLVGSCHRAPQRPRPLDPRRTRERSRSGRHRGDARPTAPPRRIRQDGVHLQPGAERGPADLHACRDHQSRQAHPGCTGRGTAPGARRV